MGDCVLAGRSLQADLLAMRNFELVLLAAGGGVLALGLGLGFWFTSRAIRPIENISAAAVRISHGNLSERVEGADTHDELGRLAGVLNETFERLQAAFERQKQFTADAAHELRTPLAVIITDAQTTLARDRRADEYREALESCLEAAQQMKRLTESLLELARFDASEEAKSLSETDISAMAQRAVEKIRPLATAHGIEIDADCKPAYAFANGGRLDQVMMNLLSNAIHYNKPQGRIRVETRTEADAAVITVADTGIGISTADLEHIFDRFYRADQARSRSDGHTGLGLAISKAIVEAEGGTISAASVLQRGTTFTVRIPVRP
jgi:heavy metal sensor kinase